jgi:fermentation-respiration switch protein FrsA (DUF1100 family)
VKLRSQDGDVVLKKNFFDDLKKWDVLSCASNISPCPLLIIHGECDELVDLEETI